MQNLNLPINIPLSDVQMSNHIKNVLTYEDFVKLTFDNILKSLPLIILYESAPGYGHWTLLHKIPSGLEFFDSYGFKPDQEFKFVDNKYKQPHVLVDFLLNMSSKYTIHYNQYKLQEESPSVSTCGRWCILERWLIQI